MKISATWSSVLQYSSSAESSWKTSDKPDRFILWVRVMCLSFGEYTFLTTRIVAWLSSRTLKTTLGPNRSSQSCRGGKPSWYNERARTQWWAVTSRFVSCLPKPTERMCLDHTVSKTPLRSNCRLNDPQQNPHPRRDGLLAVQGYHLWFRLNGSEELN